MLAWLAITSLLDGERGRLGWYFTATANAANADAKQPTELRILIYNAQFLPGVGAIVDKYGDTAELAKEIGRSITGYDIIGLCELFKPERRQELLGEIKKVWGENFYLLTATDTQRSAFGVDSGLTLVSRLPILESRSKPFGNDSSIAEYGLFADGFAAKGMLHARLAIGKGGKLDVFLTHLESTDAKIRTAQYTMLADFIKKYSDEHIPLLLLGDLNTNGPKAERARPGSQYSKLFAALNHVRPGAPFVDTWLKFHPTLPSTDPLEQWRVDYILMSPGQTTNMRLTPVSADSDPMIGEQKKPLSDHPAYKAVIKFESDAARGR
jgi:endonuclease/exonuclease/phosphatase family metal-dependent hydrolase